MDAARRHRHSNTVRPESLLLGQQGGKELGQHHIAGGTES